MKTYIVTQGEYSDYHVCSVYSKRKNAEDSLSHWGDDAAVEEFDIDHTPIIPNGLRRFSVEMNRDGDVLSLKALNNEYNDGREEEGTALFYRTTYKDESGAHHKSINFHKLIARDKQHAVKIANEKRIQIVASGGWPDEPMTAAQWKNLKS